MSKINIENIKEKFNIFEKFKNKLKNNSVSSIKLSKKLKIEFLESLFNLINAWIPITNSISIMLYQTRDKNLKFILTTISKNITKWKNLQESIEYFPKVFSNFDIYMIKMWEVTWKLSNAIEIIKTREEKNAELKSKVLWALIYPIIIVTLSILMIVWFMTFVIPKVKKMYVDARVNLPELTQSVIDISDFLIKNYLYILIVIFWIIYLFVVMNKIESTKLFLDKIILKIPIFWPLIKKKILTIFTNTFWTLLQNGIMINEALDISKKSLENKYYEKKVNEITILINEWIPLSELMWISKLKDWNEDKYFPIELASIVKIWEQTWKLPILLIKISLKYQKEIDNLVKNLSTMIEPIVIILVWSIVWTMVMAILLPFFNMANVM